MPQAKEKKERKNNKSLHEQQPKGVFDSGYSLDRCWRLSQSEIQQPPNDHSDSTILRFDSGF